MSDSIKTGANSQHHLTPRKPASKNVRQEILEKVKQLTPDELKMFTLLLRLITDKTFSKGAVLVLYYENEPVYHGSDVLQALSTYNASMKKIIEAKTKEQTKEFVFFCIHADNSVSILGEVQA